MPNQNAVMQEIIDSSSQDLVRRKYLKELSLYTNRDTIIYASSYLTMGNQNPYLQQIIPNDIRMFMAVLEGLKGESLDIILHSPGGTWEAAEQIVCYLRKKYNHIRVIVPMNAMSAATMLSCAADEIIIAKHGALGPIDPQINFIGGTLPAQTIIDDINLAKEEIAKNPGTAVLWLDKIRNYPSYNYCVAAIKASKDRVQEWLKDYMKLDKNIAQHAAEWLGDQTIHGSHGRPIGYDKLKNLNLKVKLLEDDQELQDKVLSVFHALIATFEMTNCIKIVENHNGNGRYI